MSREFDIHIHFNRGKVVGYVVSRGAKMPDPDGDSSVMFEVSSIASCDHRDVQAIVGKVASNLALRGCGHHPGPQVGLSVAAFGETYRVVSIDRELGMVTLQEDPHATP